MNTQMFKQAQKLVADNSAALLTGTGVVGVVTTALLTARATVKACEIVAKAERVTYVYAPDPAEPDEEKVDWDYFEKSVTYTIDTLDKVKLTWPLFIPPVASAATTMSAVIFSYRISASRSAVLAAAYGMSEKAFSEYKEKVLEQVTPKKANDIKDAVAQQQMEDNPPPTAMIIGEGEVLCLDSFSGRYFKSNPARIDRAANEMNAEIGNNHVARLSSFYNRIGLGDADAFGDFIWDMNNYCEIEYTTQLTDDQRPCIVLNFVQAPKPRYGQGYD